MGIFSSNCLVATLSSAIVLVYFFRQYYSEKLLLGIDLTVLKKILPFSLVNFLNAASLRLPATVFPLVILSLFSEKEAGYFYIPWTLFFVYCTLIQSVTSIFLMESSHGKDARRLLRKVIIFVFFLASAGFFIFTAFGDKILLIFKREFSENSFSTLRVLFYSIFFFSLSQIYLTLKNTEKNTLDFGILSGIILLSIVVFSAVLLPKAGSNGIGWGRLLGNLMGNIYIGLEYLRIKCISGRST